MYFSHPYSNLAHVSLYESSFVLNDPCIFNLDACFLTREENQWYKEPSSLTASFSEDTVSGVGSTAE